MLLNTVPYSIIIIDTILIICLTLFSGYLPVPTRKRRRKDATHLPAAVTAAEVPVPDSPWSDYDGSATSGESPAPDFESSLEDLEDIDAALQRNITGTISQRIRDTRGDIKIRKNELKKRLDSALRVSMLTVHA